MKNLFVKKTSAVKATLSATLYAVLLSATSMVCFAADYPENKDYGNKGDFVAKRGSEYGRTTNLMTIGPILINQPEAPGSNSVGLPDGVTYKAEETAWDLSDLTNPTLIRSLTCDTCGLGQPIAAHATVVRFHKEKGPLLYARGPGELSYNPLADTSNDQLEVDTSWPFASEPLGYSNLTSPYFVRPYWEYGFDPSGQMAIRDLANRPETATGTGYSLVGTKWDGILNENALVTWLGTPLTHWNHLPLTGVTGFSSWFGNLLVVASDQRSTGIAIYDTEGFREGRIPRLLSVYQPELTEPNGNKVGVGGYWMEPYGANKIVFAARRHGDVPVRDYSGMFVIDFTVPTAPRLSCAVFFDQDKEDPSDGDRTSDPMYVNFQDEYAFVDHFKVNIKACEEAYDDEEISAQEFDEIVYKFADIDNGCDASQYFRPLGQVGIFGGYNYWGTPDVNEQGMCFFVTDDEPDTRAPFVSGHRPLANQTDYPVDGFIHLHIPETLRSETVQNAIAVTNMSTGVAITYRHQLSHTGTISIWPDEYLAAETTYQVSVTGIQDFMGNTMEDYQYSFTTDDGVVTGPDGDDGSSFENIAPTYSPTAPETSYFANKSSQLSCRSDSFSPDVWAVNPDNDSVTIISQNVDAAVLSVSPTLKYEIKLGYQAPTSVTHMVIDRWQHFYAVTYRDDDKVVIFDDKGAPTFSIDTGHGSQPISSVYSDGRLFVALYGSGEVIEVNIADKEISQRVKVGPTPKAMALLDNRLLVTRFISTMNNGEVYDMNISDGLTLTRTIDIKKVLVPDDLFHGSGVPNYLSSIVINQQGTLAYVTATKANVDSGLFRKGTALDDDNTIRAMIARIDLVNNVDANSNENTAEGTEDLDNSGDVSAVTFLVNSNIRVHAQQANNIVKVHNFSTNASWEYETGNAPQDMCVTERILYVKNFTDRSVSAIDVAGFMYDGRLTNEVTTVSTVTEEVLPTQELAGLQLFYHAREDMSPEGYISCASCHAGGSHDGMTWDMTHMGEGIRNTLSLNGASGTRFGNLHWSANFDEVQDFEVQLEKLNGAEGLIPDITFTSGVNPLNHLSAGLNPALDSLAAYVNGLGKDTVKRSPYRTYTGQLTAAAMRGKTVFDNDNCASCHSGNSYRDGLTHDVGTITTASGNRLGGVLSAIRTPTLIELWNSAPYLHDGSAAQLSDVFTIGDHQREFTGSEQADLLEYLRSIDREVYIDDE